MPPGGLDLHIFILDDPLVEKVEMNLLGPGNISFLKSPPLPTTGRQSATGPAIELIIDRASQGTLLKMTSST